MASSSSMKMMAGAASRACLNRSRTRLAPTPTIISTNSLAPMLKNGTFASPATAGQESLARTRCADEQNTFRDSASQSGVFLRIPQEVDDFLELLLGLVDACDV